MVGEAKAKLEEVQSQLNAARIDYEATRAAAEKASLSAQEAQNNAQEAGVHASLGLHESSLSNISSGYDETEHAPNHNYQEDPSQKYDLAGY